MKEYYYKVFLYHGGESADEIKTTDNIETARKWVAQSEHGVIENEQGINVQ